ncbi:leucine Rich repeat-containing domain protein [Ancylostoma ceylanicum]|uniref:Leucine Rich repeat-containing domain protein n=1 Tax=Ancylostoma ceylanicum TaxID=53326 RepID=A0A0D6LUF8_9BILA|nr:leucine Rich repeat-containing domain protein [Ancylostoma ceylanicum]
MASSDHVALPGIDLALMAHKGSIYSTFAFLSSDLFLFLEMRIILPQRVKMVFWIFPAVDCAVLTESTEKIMVDATDNQLHKLSSFLSLAKQLKALLLSNNGIKNMDNLRSFVNLENLDISCNDIEVIPSNLDNRRLSRIDLSSNALTSLPDLSKLTSLTHLDVSSNQISSFKNAVFPGSLLVLNVSSNNIDDLTEFMRLLPLEKLESISLGETKLSRLYYISVHALSPSANNPCVSNITFDYRIYILSVLPSLQDIDGFVVNEEEQLKGEWLYSQGKGRAFKPDTGAHLSLVRWFTPSFLFFNSYGDLRTEMQAMEKRREMLSSSAYEDDSSHSLSLHSPYRAWTAQLEGKENQIPSSSADETSRSISARIPASSTPARQPSATARSSARFEPPSRSSTMESVESSSTVTLVPAAKGHQEEQRGTLSTATTARADRSGRLYLRERIVQLEQDAEVTEAQQHQQVQHVEQVDHRRCRDSTDHGTAAVRPTFAAAQRCKTKPRAGRPSPVPVVTDISMDMGPRGSHRVQHDESEVLHRLSCLEERALQLSVQNENLTRINDELSGLLVEMTNKFRSDMNSLRAQLASLETAHHPDPCNLRVARELSDGCYEIIWDLPLVQCYKVLTNGVESGIVRAPNNAARISDVEPGTELRVQVQAIHFDGKLGEPSNTLVIRRSER